MKHLIFAAFALIASSGAALSGTDASLPQCSGFPSGGDGLECSCTGAESGSVWGSGPYTSDSNVCVAARHAGVIDASGGGVSAYAVDGQSAYPGSEQNGVTTSTWGSYGSSFDFASATASANVQACAAFPGGDDAYMCSCNGDESGSVWGSGPYTSDSNLCVAARHGGVIDASGGTIMVRGADGMEAYPSSTQNGVTTSSWGSYGTSVVIGLK